MKVDPCSFFSFFMEGLFFILFSPIVKLWIFYVTTDDNRRMGKKNLPFKK
jgi:hypothetical protein